MHCTSKMGVGPEIIIPTQQRYLDYLSAMLAGKKPTATPVSRSLVKPDMIVPPSIHQTAALQPVSSCSLCTCVLLMPSCRRQMLLERVIMNGIPQLSGSASSSGPSDSGSPAHSASAGACRPYLQIFKDGQLLFTSTGRDSTELRWYTAADSCVLFPVGLQLEGDILVRVRHLDEKKKRISMLRFGLHTGFVAAGNTRLLKSQLDGAYNDSRFPRAFWIDLIFRPAAQPDPDSEEGQRQLEKQRLQQQYWEQINSARRQTKSAADLNAPPRHTTPAAAATGDAAAGGNAASPVVASPVDATASSSSPPVAASADASSKSKPSLGALFSSATSKLQLGLTGLSLFGAGDSASGESAHGLDLSDPAVAKLHAADQDAMRKAKRRAATEAAVQAALQSPHARSGSQSATPVKPVPKPAGSDDTSFADLQRYVQGLSSVDAHELEVNSDDEIGTSQQRSTQQQDEADLDRAMNQHFDSPDASVGTAAPTAAKPAALSDEDIFASLAAETASNTAVASSTSTSVAVPSVASLDASDAASLEAELALLSAGDIDLGADGDEEVLLDDADEAALLASLQDEMVSARQRTRTHTLSHRDHPNSTTHRCLRLFVWLCRMATSESLRPAALPLSHTCPHQTVLNIFIHRICFHLLCAFSQRVHTQAMRQCNFQPMCGPDCATGRLGDSELVRTSTASSSFPPAPSS